MHFRNKPNTTLQFFGKQKRYWNRNAWFQWLTWTPGETRRLWGLKALVILNWIQQMAYRCRCHQKKTHGDWIIDEVLILPQASPPKKNEEKKLEKKKKNAQEFFQLLMQKWHFFKFRFGFQHRAFGLATRELTASQRLGDSSSIRIEKKNTTKSHLASCATGFLP